MTMMDNVVFSWCHCIHQCLHISYTLFIHMCTFTMTFYILKDFFQIFPHTPVFVMVILEKIDNIPKYFKKVLSYFFDNCSYETNERNVTFIAIWLSRFFYCNKQAMILDDQNRVILNLTLPIRNIIIFPS